MPSKYEPMARICNAEAMALLDECREWANRTNSSLYVLCRAARVSDEWMKSVRKGAGMMRRSADRVRQAMELNPDGLTAPRPAPFIVRELVTGDELQRRRDAVERERRDRVRQLLAQEKPGFCGRVWSNRAVWEMPA